MTDEQPVLETYSKKQVHILIVIIGVVFLLLFCWAIYDQVHTAHVRGFAVATLNGTSSYLILGTQLENYNTICIDNNKQLWRNEK